MDARKRAKQWQKFHASNERRFERGLRSLAKEQNQRIVDGFAQHGGITIDALEAFFDVDAETDLFKDEVAPWIEVLVGHAAKYSPATPSPSLRVGLTKAGEPPHDFIFEQRLTDAVASVLGELEKQDYWRKIQRTVKESVTGFVEAHIKMGTPEREMAKDLQRFLGQSSKLRAKRIARTEVTMALNAGHQASYDSLKIEGVGLKKKWLAILDNDVRVSHEHLNGVAVESDGEFDVGGNVAPYPGHWSLPADQRINCRCTTVAVVE